MVQGLGQKAGEAPYEIPPLRFSIEDPEAVLLAERMQRIGAILLGADYGEPAQSFKASHWARGDDGPEASVEVYRLADDHKGSRRVSVMVFLRAGNDMQGEVHFAEGENAVVEITPSVMYEPSVTPVEVLAKTLVGVEAIIQEIQGCA